MAQSSWQGRLHDLLQQTDRNLHGASSAIGPSPIGSSTTIGPSAMASLPLHKPTLQPPKTLRFAESAELRGNPLPHQKTLSEISGDVVSMLAKAADVEEIKAKMSTMQSEFSRFNERLYSLAEQSKQQETWREDSFTRLKGQLEKDLASGFRIVEERLRSHEEERRKMRHEFASLKQQYMESYKSTEQTLRQNEIDYQQLENYCHSLREEVSATMEVSRTLRIENDNLQRKLNELKENDTALQHKLHELEKKRAKETEESSTAVLEEQKETMARLNELEKSVRELILSSKAAQIKAQALEDSVTVISEELPGKVSTLRKQVQAHNQKVEQSELRISAMEQELEAKFSQMAMKRDLEKASSLLRNEVESLLQKIASRMDDVQVSVAKYGGTTTDIRSEVAAAARQQTEQAIAHLRDRISAEHNLLHEQINGLDQVLKQQSKMTTEQNASILKLQTVSGSESQKLAALARDLAQLHEEFKTQTKVDYARESRVTQIEEMILSTDKHLQTLLEKYKKEYTLSLEQTTASFVTEMQRKNNVIDHLQVVIQDLVKQTKAFVSTEDMHRHIKENYGLEQTRLQQECYELRGQIDSLGKKLDVHEHHNELLKERWTEMTSRIQTQSQESEKLAHNIQDLQLAKKSHEARLEEYQKQLATIEKSMERSHGGLEQSAKQNFRSIEDRIVQLVSVCQGLEGMIKEEAQNRLFVERRLHEEITKIMSQRVEFEASLGKRLHEFQVEENNPIVQRISLLRQDMNAVLESERSLTREMTDQFSTFQENQNDLCKQHSQLQFQINVLREFAEATKAQQTITERSLKQHETSIEQVNLSVKGSHRDMVKQISLLENKAESLSVEFTALSANIQQMDQGTKENTDLFQQLEKAVLVLTDDVSQLKKTSDEMKRDFEEKLVSVDLLQGRSLQLQNDFTSTRGSLQDLESQSRDHYQKISTELQGLREEKRRSDEKIVRFQQSLSDMQLLFEQEQSWRDDCAEKMNEINLMLGDAMSAVKECGDKQMVLFENSDLINQALDGLHRTLAAVIEKQETLFKRVLDEVEQKLGTVQEKLGHVETELHDELKRQIIDVCNENVLVQERLQGMATENGALIVEEVHRLFDALRTESLDGQRSLEQKVVLYEQQQAQLRELDKSIFDQQREALEGGLEEALQKLKELSNREQERVTKMFMETNGLVEDTVEQMKQEMSSKLGELTENWEARLGDVEEMVDDIEAQLQKIILEKQQVIKDREVIWRDVKNAHEYIDSIRRQLNDEKTKPEKDIELMQRLYSEAQTHVASLLGSPESEANPPQLGLLALLSQMAHTWFDDQLEDLYENLNSCREVALAPISQEENGGQHEGPIPMADIGKVIEVIMNELVDVRMELSARRMDGETMKSIVANLQVTLNEIRDDWEKGSQRSLLSPTEGKPDAYVSSVLRATLNATVISSESDSDPDLLLGGRK